MSKAKGKVPIAASPVQVEEVKEIDPKKEEEERERKKKEEKEKLYQEKLAQHKQRVVFPIFPIKKIVSYHSSTILAEDEPFGYPIKEEILTILHEYFDKYSQIYPVDSSNLSSEQKSEEKEILVDDLWKIVYLILEKHGSVRDYNLKFLQQTVYKYLKKSNLIPIDYEEIYLTKYEEIISLSSLPELSAPDKNAKKGKKEEISVTNVNLPSLSSLISKTKLDLTNFLSFFKYYYADPYYYGERLRKFIERNELIDAHEILLRFCDINTSNGEGISSLHIVCEKNNLNLLKFLHDVGQYDLKFRKKLNDLKKNEKENLFRDNENEKENEKTADKKDAGKMDAGKKDTGKKDTGKKDSKNAPAASNLPYQYILDNFDELEDNDININDLELLCKNLNKFYLQFNTKDNQGWTPLHICCYFNCFNCLQYLVEEVNSINLFSLTNNLQNILHLCIKQNHFKIVYYLIQYIEKQIHTLSSLTDSNSQDLLEKYFQLFKQQDINGMTPLHIASYCRHPSLYAELLSFNLFPIDVKDSMGYLPQDYIDNWKEIEKSKI